MKKVILLLITMVSILVSCSQLPESSPFVKTTPTEIKTPTATMTPKPNPTLDRFDLTRIALATNYAIWFPMPTTPQEYPTPLPPATNYVGDIVAYSNTTMFVGKYVLRSWRYVDFTDVVTISAVGKEQISVSDHRVWIDKATGKDLNGDGFPEAIIRTYVGGTGAGAPCNTVSIVSLADRPETILNKAPNCSDRVLGREYREAGKTGDFFIDIDNDGTFEFITFGFQLGDWFESPSFMYVWKYDFSSHNYTIVSTKKITISEYDDMFLKLSQNEVP